ncbi:hypothetical protein EDD11_006003 [Mortierella claussenii]|nr:hypothetical protein EDD11_006003 [Mortierella claussenii]
MINVVDFFPAHARRHVTKEQRDQLELSESFSSALVMDMPLRYVFQYALNHLQEQEEEEHQQGEEPHHQQQRLFTPRSVLIVTPSRDHIREWMLHERNLYHPEGTVDEVIEGSGTQGSSAVLREQTGRAKSPWQHLFPSESLQSLRKLDEFMSSTQTQTQTQTQSQRHRQEQDQEQASQMQVDLSSQQILSPKPQQSAVDEREDGSQTMSISGGSLQASMPLGGSDVDDSALALTSRECDGNGQDIRTGHPSHIHSDDKDAPEQFRIDLWSRIQLRYAPTLLHVQSLFRCLHLDPEATPGNTFGSYRYQTQNSRGDGSDRGFSHTGWREEEQPEDVEVSQEDQSRHGIALSLPTLIILMNCFHGEQEDSSGDGSCQHPSSLCVLPSHQADTPSVVKNVGGSMRMMSQLSSRHQQFSSQYQQYQSQHMAFQSYPLPSALSMTNTPRARDEETADRVQYIKATSQTLSEVKDSLEWIKRISGQNPKLLLCEHTKSSLTPPILDSCVSPLSPRSRLTLSSRELWLKEIIGFWTDAIVTVQRRSPTITQDAQHPAQTLPPPSSSPLLPFSQGMPDEGEVTSVRTKSQMSSGLLEKGKEDSMRLWIETSQRRRAVFSTTTKTAPDLRSGNTAAVGARDRKGEGEGEGKEAEVEQSAASVGAVVGLRWDYNMTEAQFLFQVLT